MDANPVSREFQGQALHRMPPARECSYYEMPRRLPFFIRVTCGCAFKRLQIRPSLGIARLDPALGLSQGRFVPVTYVQDADGGSLRVVGSHVKVLSLLTQLLQHVGRRISVNNLQNPRISSTDRSILFPIPDLQTG
jgi:hypothetical protein